MPPGAPAFREDRARLRALPVAAAVVAVVVLVAVLAGERAALVTGLVLGGALAAVLLSTLQAERAGRRRSELTARAGELLGAQLQPDTLLTQITGLPVPDHADLAIVDLLQPDGSLRGAVTNAADPELAAALADLRERFPLDPQSEHPVAVALRTGEPQLLAEMTAAQLRRFASNEEHERLMLRARYRSAMVLPLTARGRTAGVLSLLRVRDGTPFAEDDLASGLDIAHRAALALDNARLFAELQETEQQLEAIVANLGEAVTAFAPDGAILFANQAAADVAGLASPDDLRRADPRALAAGWVVLDEHGEELPRDRRPVPRALAGERPEPTVVRMIHRETGRDRWLLERAAPVRGEDGALRFVVSVAEDVGPVKRQERRERLLSTASKLLGSSLDVEATLDKAAWAVVPELADWARVDLPDERGVLRQAAVAHRDLEMVEMLNEWRRDYPPDPADDRGPAQVLRTGRPVVWDRIDADDVARYAQSPRHAELMRIIHTRSIIIVPLSAGDRVIGTLQLATTAETERRLGAEQLEIAEELARRAAIAVENARVHAERTHIAATLQHSLLPPRLPVIPGLTIAARFRAAGTATEVGGDFYDLFEARGRWMVLVGDVTGKGPGAAAVTSLARYTMRTIAQYEDDPTDMLERLNATLGADADRRQICTAVCVSVRPAGDDRATARLEIVCAGHPSPLLVAADGAVRAVGRPGTLLGAFAQGAWTASTCDLAPGEALVLYTDGVTDTRGPDGRFGAERLMALLAEIGPGDADRIAQGIDEALQGFGEQRDDVAVLVLCGSEPARADEGDASFVSA